MKRSILVLALCCAASVANAEINQAYCDVEAKFAKIYMGFRQADAALVDIMREVPPSDDFLRDILLDAFTYPVFSSRENKEKAAIEFQNKYYVDCLREVAAQGSP